MSESKSWADGLKALREPFPSSQIGKLPKGGTLLDFVGHGYLTARFLDVDPEWNWEPFALDPNGLPLLDEHGGLWMRLTICGVTRIGYGDAGGKTGPNAIKEAIGDALRNSGMRFGAALDLWCKGDPDAPPPPTQAQLAQRRLLQFCSTINADPEKVAEQFLDKTQVDIRQADAAAIDAFTETLKAGGVPA